MKGNLGSVRDRIVPVRCVYFADVKLFQSVPDLFEDLVCFRHRCITPASMSDVEAPRGSRQLLESTR